MVTIKNIVVKAFFSNYVQQNIIGNAKERLLFIKFAAGKCNRPVTKLGHMRPKVVVFMYFCVVSARFRLFKLFMHFLALVTSRVRPNFPGNTSLTGPLRGSILLS